MAMAVDSSGGCRQARRVHDPGGQVDSEGVPGGEMTTARIASGPFWAQGGDDVGGDQQVVGDVR